jgi:predicted dehydrogenase
LLRWWLGEPTAAFGQALTIVPDRIDRLSGETWTATADDLSHFTLEMQSGALAQVFMSSVAANDLGNVTQVFGSKGTLTLSNSDETLYFAKAGEKVFTDISVDNPHSRRNNLNKGIWNVSVLAALQELVAAIVDKRELLRGATLVDGLRNQMVLDAVQASTQQRCWQDLDMSVAV